MYLNAFIARLTWAFSSTMIYIADFRPFRLWSLCHQLVIAFNQDYSEIQDYFDHIWLPPVQKINNFAGGIRGNCGQLIMPEHSTHHICGIYMRIPEPCTADGRFIRILRLRLKVFNFFKQRHPKTPKRLKVSYNFNQQFFQTFLKLQFKVETIQSLKKQTITSQHNFRQYRSLHCLCSYSCPYIAYAVTLVLTLLMQLLLSSCDFIISLSTTVIILINFLVLF